MTNLDNNLPILHSEFNLVQLRQGLADLCVLKRMNHASNWFQEISIPGKRIVLTSSFGIQSVLLLSHLDKLDFDISVVTVDITGEKYDDQRAYRDTLQKELGFDLHVFHARDDQDKVRAMDEGLAEINAGLVFSGIRASQTYIRQQKSIAEVNDRNETVEVFPLLDWSDAKLDDYLSKFPSELHHPGYEPGAQSRGGVVIANDQPKTECGLHGLFDPQI